MHPSGLCPYRWNVFPQKQHLFHKNLSLLSTSAYTQIIDGIGTFLEAISAKFNGGLCENESTKLRQMCIHYRAAISLLNTKLAYKGQY